MTNGVNATLEVRIFGTDVKSPALGSEALSIDQLWQMVLSAGNAAAGKADGCYVASFNIAASASLTEVLSALTDSLGNSIALTEVQAIYIASDPTNANNVVVGNAASHPWQGPFGAATATIAIKPGGNLFFGDPFGWAVSSGVSDQLMLTNGGSGTAVTGQLIVVGRTA